MLIDVFSILVFGGTGSGKVLDDVTPHPILPLQNAGLLCRNRQADIDAHFFYVLELDPGGFPAAGDSEAACQRLDQPGAAVEPFCERFDSALDGNDAGPGSLVALDDDPIDTADPPPLIVDD